MSYSVNSAPGDLDVNRDKYPSTLEANYVLGLLFVCYTFSFIDRQVLGVLVGPIKADLGLSDFQFSLLQGAAFAILYSVMALPFGRLADATSRKWIMSIGVLGWSIATVGCGLAKSFGQLFTMRMAVGVGEAALSPAAYSTITDSFPREKLTRAMAIYKAGVLVGGGLALVLGGALHDFFATIDDLSLPLIGPVAPWQATFVAVGLPGLLLALLLALTREPKRKGLLRDAKTSTARSLSIKEVFAYLFVEHRRLYVGIFGGCALLAIVSYGYSSWFTEMLIRNFSLTRGHAGSMYGSVVIGAGLTGVLSGPVMVSFFQRRGYLDSNMRVLMLIGISLFPAAVAAPQMPSYTLALALVAVTVFLQAAYIGVAAAAIQMVTPNQMRGQVTALYIFCVNMLGLAVGSTLVAATTDFAFGDEAALKHSISVVSACLVPFAVFLFWRGLPAFKAAIEEADTWG